MNLQIFFQKVLISLPKIKLTRFLFILFSITLLQCQSEEEKILPAFYHWKTNFQLSSFEQNYLKQLKAERLYIRFFDIDWNSQSSKPLPLADVYFEKDSTPTQTIIPTIFITNRTMIHIADKNIADLANKIVIRINQAATKYQLSYQEIQLDCDWSQKSKNKFFELVRQVKSLVKKQNISISTTIRLHQLKYFNQTGIPPADKGMLMFYNMGELDGSNTDNSILDLSVAKTYLKNLKDYPLPLDFALPVYGWAVLKRDNKIINLINNVASDELKSSKDFKQQNGKNFSVENSHYFHSLYLYKGDELRVEEVSLEQLHQAADLLKDLINQKKTYIVYYHLDEHNLKKYTYENLQSILNHFH